MTSSSSARDAPVRRSRRSSPEPALPSCSWTRTRFGAIRSCRLTRFIRRVWWRARDVEALPYFFLGQDEGALAGKRRAGIDRELRLRRRLLAEAEASEA